jgi:hypothetical protein
MVESWHDWPLSPAHRAPDDRGGDGERGLRASARYARSSVTALPDIDVDYAFLFLTALYLVDVVVRAIGLGWTAFRRTLWNLYDIAVVGGTAATTIAVLANTNGAVVQLQKLFLVSIAFKLVQKNDSLNTLFKTSVGSLPAILDLLLLWFALFIVWAIAYLEIFSLTKWQASENHNANFTSLGKSLVMLAFMSVGEGWNAYMHDYTVTTPLCTDSPSFLFTDCGSPAWAFIMFLSWNVISMYIFANMYVLYLCLAKLIL